MTTQAERHFYTLAAPARSLYINAVKARGAKLKNGKESEPKFDATVMLAPESADYAGIRAAIIAAAAEKWPGRQIGAEIQGGTFNVPFQDGNAHADKEKAKGKEKEAARGFKLLKASSKFQPTLSIIQGGAVVDLETPEAIAMHASKFYPGVIVGIEIELVPYDKVKDNENDGVSARLFKVITLNKGDKLGGTSGTGADTFKHYAGIVSDEDPTKAKDTVADNAW